MTYLKIRLRSDLCAGSGESFGNIIDSDICMDAYGLPYLPARRIKGCLKQAAKDLQRFGCEAASEERIDRLFGIPYVQRGTLSVRDAYLDGTEEMRGWLRRQEQIPVILRAEAKPAGVIELFSSVRGQTKMENGIKVDNSLRFTRVLNRYSPLEPNKENELFAQVALEGNDPQDKELLLLCCKALRHIGSHRNRGLGEVLVTLEEKSQTAETETVVQTAGTDGETVCITYRLNLDAPIVMQGCGEQLTEIPSRNVIGCLAGEYLKNGSPEDETFRRLFLDGSVIWSALTPVIEGQISVPTPAMLAYKKRSKIYVNRTEFAKQRDQDEENREKLKLLTGTYCIQREDGYSVASVSSHTVYHHQHRNEKNDGTLYMQQSLDAGMVYGGTVIVPAALVEEVYRLLTTVQFRFGRSRTAQYAACSLAGMPEYSVVTEKKLPSKCGEAVYIILESDMLLVKDGMYVLDNDGTRAAIAEKLGLNSGKSPKKQMDYCVFRTISGFQTQWQMQKEQLPVIAGGSIFCFVSNGKAMPETFRVGELPQEDFGRCRVITESQMQKLKNVRKTDVTQKKTPDSAKYSERLRTLMIVSAAKKALLQKAFYYSKRVNRMETGLLGRLRLMLDESENYNDFLKRVNSIKNSDKSSAKSKGRGELAVSYVEQLYGKEQISLDRLIDSTELLELIKADAEAEKQILMMWKLPMKKALHLAYYGKEG